MRRSPSIVPEAIDRDIYLVLDDFGRHGRSWRETDEEDTDRATLVRDMLKGEYNAPIRVVAFNMAERWSRDVSEDIADEIARSCSEADIDIPSALEDFVQLHGSGRSSQLPLPLKGAA